MVVFAFLVRGESGNAPPPDEGPVWSQPFSLRYRDQAALVVGNFLKAKAALSSPDEGGADLLPLLSGARRDLLALAVPSPEREPHLRLVGAAADWEEGIRSGDAGLIRRGSGSFFLLLDEFPWLGKGFVR